MMKMCVMMWLEVLNTDHIPKLTAARSEVPGYVPCFTILVK